MPTRKHTKSSPTTAAKPKRTRTLKRAPRARKAIGSRAVSAPQKSIQAGAAAPKLSKPEQKDELLPRVGTAASTLMVIAARVVGMGRDLIDKFRGER